jgi:hypothetical protein
MDIIMAAQMALAACDDIALVACDRQAIIELGGLLGAYNEGDDDTVIWDADGYAVMPADPEAARERADTSVADCGADPDKQDHPRRRDDGEELPPVSDPVTIPQPVFKTPVTEAEPMVVETTTADAAAAEPVMEAPVTEPVVEEGVPDAVLPETPEPAPAVDLSSEPVVDEGLAEVVPSASQSGLEYVLPVSRGESPADDSEVDSTDDGSAEERSSSTITVDQLSFLLSEDGATLTGLVRLAATPDATAAGITSLRLSVVYRAAGEAGWQSAGEAASCRLDRELPLDLESQGGETVDVAFECSLSSAIPGGAAVRVRVEALDLEDGRASQEVGRGL